MAIGSRLRKLRMKHGLTQKEMAEKIELKQSTYSNYENNNRSVPKEVLQKIGSIFDVELIDLITPDHPDYWEYVSYLKEKEIDELWSKGIRKDILEIIDQLNNKGIFTILTICKGLVQESFFRKELTPLEEYQEAQFKEDEKAFNKALKLYIKVNKIEKHKYIETEFSHYLMNNNLSPYDYIKKYEEN